MKLYRGGGLPSPTPSACSQWPLLVSWSSLDEPLCSLLVTYPKDSRRAFYNGKIAYVNKSNTRKNALALRPLVVKINDQSHVTRWNHLNFAWPAVSQTVESRSIGGIFPQRNHIFTRSSSCFTCLYKKIFIIKTKLEKTTSLAISSDVRDYEGEGPVGLADFKRGV